MRPVVHPMSPAAHVQASVAPHDRHQSQSSEAASGRDSYLVVRVGTEQFGLPLESVAEALETPVVMQVAGVDGRLSSFVEWRGKALPLIAARVPFGIESELPCAVALIMTDPLQPVAVAVDELCEVRELPPSDLRPFAGRADEHRVARFVVVDGQTFIAIVNPTAMRAAILSDAPTNSARWTSDPERSV